MRGIVDTPGKELVAQHSFEQANQAGTDRLQIQARAQLAGGSHVPQHGVENPDELHKPLRERHDVASLADVTSLQQKY